MIKQVAITEFLTAAEIRRASNLYRLCQREGEPFVPQCERDIIRPAIARIDRALGQENDPRYLAYMVEYVMSLTWGPS